MCSIALTDIYGLVVVMHFYIFSGVSFANTHASDTADVYCDVVFACRYAKIHSRGAASQHSTLQDKSPSVSDILNTSRSYFLHPHDSLVPPMVVLLAKVSIPWSQICLRIYQVHCIARQNPLVPKYDLSSVTMCMSGAAPLSAELTQQYCDRLPNSAIGQGYGEQLHTSKTDVSAPGLKPCDA